MIVKRLVFSAAVAVFSLLVAQPARAAKGWDKSSRDYIFAQCVISQTDSHDDPASQSKSIAACQCATKRVMSEIDAFDLAAGIPKGDSDSEPTSEAFKRFGAIMEECINGNP